VSVVSGEQLTRATQGAFLEEALRAVPGVQIQNRYNFAVGERVSIRGFGARSQFGVRGVRILVDGIPATLPDGQATIDHLDLAGLGRVEALRGPSAAMYGNAAGGVLHFRSIDPASVPAAVTVRSTSSGSDSPWSGGNLWSFQADATGTSGDVGYRVGGSRMEFDGYRRDPVADDGSAYGAATRTVVNGTVTMPLGPGDLHVVANGIDLFAENPGSLNQTQLDQGDRQAFTNNILIGAIKEVRQGQVGGSWTGDLGETEAEFALWGLRRELYNPIPGAIVDLNRYAGGLRAVGQRTAETANGSFRLSGGLEFENQWDDRQNRQNNSGTPGALTLDQDETVRGLGVFAQGRLDFAAGVSLLAGIRYDRISFSVDDAFTGGGDPDDSGSRTMDAVSPSLGVVASPAAGVELFGSVSRSFETPTTTELANQPSGAGGFNPDLEPQYGLTFEGGARVGVGSPWQVEGTLFHTKLTDGLVPFDIAGRTYYQNAAEARHFGWEVALAGRPAPGLTLRTAYTHVDAEYVMFVSSSDDFSGNAVPGLAPTRLDALAMYDGRLGYVELRGLYQDDMPVDDAGTAESPSYWLVDVRVGSGDVRLGGASLAPFFGIANLFDERYNASVVPNAFGGRFYEPGPARTYQIGLGVTWGR
jgi:iron complex outermembrane receptor protein